MPEYAEGVTLITCTGGRKQALWLCAGFVARQTYEGPLQWIVVDDVGPNPLSGSGNGWRYPRKHPEEFKLTTLAPSPAWQPGQNTLARNLLAAIPCVMYDKVLFIEDDDWYAPDYVEFMVGQLERASIVGETESGYYHVPSKRWRVMENEGMASLCQTGVIAELLPILAYVCRNSPQFIDREFWDRPQRQYLTGWSGRVVGMKGLPGRPGIGVGHRPDSRPEGWKADPDLSVLKSWIGNDVELYREFMQ